MPLRLSLVGRATVGVRVYEHTRGAGLWVVPGLQDEGNDEEPELSDALLPLLPVHALIIIITVHLLGEYDKSRKRLQYSVSVCRCSCHRVSAAGKAVSL